MTNYSLDPYVEEVVSWAKTKSDDKDAGLGYHPDRVTPLLLARLIRDIEMMLPKLTAIQDELESKKKPGV